MAAEPHGGRVRAPVQRNRWRAVGEQERRYHQQTCALLISKPYMYLKPAVAMIRERANVQGELTFLLLLLFVCGQIWPKLE